MTVALYPGSFDPVHNGHVAIIEAAAAVMDAVVVGIGHHPTKTSGMFTPNERAELIELCTEHLDNVTVRLFSGLVTVAAREFGADVLVKGLRSGGDLDDEMAQAHMNLVTGEIPTMFLPASGPSARVASTYVRQIAAMGGDISDTVAPSVAAAIARKLDK